MVFGFSAEAFGAAAAASSLDASTALPVVFDFSAVAFGAAAAAVSGLGVSTVFSVVFDFPVLLAGASVVLAGVVLTLEAFASGVGFSGSWLLEASGLISELFTVSPEMGPGVTSSFPCLAGSWIFVRLAREFSVCLAPGFSRVIRRGVCGVRETCRGVIGGLEALVPARAWA